MNSNLKTIDMKIELEKWQVKALRNYFGLNDKTSLEHWAYDVFNKALKDQSTIPTVVEQSEQLPCGDLIKHNFSISKIGRCIPCDRSKEKAR